MHILSWFRCVVFYCMVYFNVTCKITPNLDTDKAFLLCHNIIIIASTPQSQPAYTETEFSDYIILQHGCPICRAVNKLFFTARCQDILKRKNFCSQSMFTKSISFLKRLTVEYTLVLDLGHQNRFRTFFYAFNLGNHI